MKSFYRKFHFKCPILLLHQLNLAKKTKVERKFIKEEKCRNATAFQVFLTQRNFLYAEYLTARFSWWNNSSTGEKLGGFSPTLVS